MDQVDEMLSIVRCTPVPEALGAIEAPVMALIVAGVAQSRERSAGRRSVALACAVAAVVGLWGGFSVPELDGGHGGGDREGALLAIPASAPSHLLAG
jgi:hypothetical protein